MNRLCELVVEAFKPTPGLAFRYPDSQAADGIDPAILIAYVDDHSGHDRRYAIE